MKRPIPNQRDRMMRARDTTTRSNTMPSKDTPPAACADERVEIKITAPTPPDAPRYRPGTRIRLTRGEIKALGLPATTYTVLGE